MQRIYPICEEKVRSCIGKPVCAVLHDGTCIQGIISDVRDGNVYFSHRQGPVLSGKKERKGKKSQRNKAEINAWGYGFGFGYPFISLALLALLFTIPFLGFPFF